MAIHDRYARRTPYELAIPGRDFAEEHFAAIRREGRSAGRNLADPSQFLFLEGVNRVIQAIAGDPSGAGTGADAFPGSAGGTAGIQHHAGILFHAYRFWEAGEPLVLVPEPVARALVERCRAGLAEGAGAPDGEGEGDPGAPAAGYLQLPRNLFWARPDPQGPAEALDGIFWSRGPGHLLQILAVLGVRDDRPGMSVVELPSLAPDLLAEARAHPAREDGEDFANDLPGGELEDLYSIQSGGEVVKLALAALEILELQGLPAATPPATAGGGAPEGTPGDPGSPDPSALPYHRLEV